jgi:hypothetical protein
MEGDMKRFKYIRAAVLITAVASMVFAGMDRRPPYASNTQVVEALPDPIASTSTFFTVRPDLRRCASPMCGGYFVKRVNLPTTRCANGRNMSECYVKSILWSGQVEVAANRALLRGVIIKDGMYGVLKIDESWQAATETKPVGEFFRTRDLGLRCIAAPCLSHSEAKLNSTVSKKVAGVDITTAGAPDDVVSEAFQAMTSEEGVLVAGTHSTVTGPAGRAQELKASQFYLRAKSPTSANMKPCIKTGCSGQICSDETMMSTCEYRAEYECYKKAACERQANGNCGFTKTPELTSCLARK